MSYLELQGCQSPEVCLVIFLKLFHYCFPFQVLDLPPEEKLSDETVSNIMPYLLEAGVDVKLLYSNKKMVCQCVLMHNVIEKRKIELDDILIGKKKTAFSISIL